MRLQDQVCIITGAGSGSGQSSAILFGREQAIVVVADIDREKGEETVQQIVSAGGRAAFIHADVTSPESAKALIDETIRLYGKIDVLFNNAGISGVGMLHEIEPDAWDRVMNVNIKGVYLPSKYALPYMMERKAGSIINMSSCIAEIGDRKSVV